MISDAIVSWTKYPLICNKHITWNAYSWSHWNKMHRVLSTNLYNIWMLLDRLAILPALIDIQAKTQIKNKFSFFLACTHGSFVFQCEYIEYIAGFLFCCCRLMVMVAENPSNRANFHSSMYMYTFNRNTHAHTRSHNWFKYAFSYRIGSPNGNNGGTDIASYS